MRGNGKKVVLAMSGGVDSSVAAALLLREGYSVIGVFMRLGSPAGVEAHEAGAHDDMAHDPRLGMDGTHHDGAATGAGCSTAGKHKQGCCSVLDADDARRVAGILDLPFYVLNFQEDFGRVIDYFVAEYNRGRTPNPCVRCNDWLKFGKLAQYAEAVGADFVASGHYARAKTDPLTGARQLLRGVDHHKDQSYVLFGMSRETLDHTLLPIGGYQKHEVRAIAQEMKLPVFNKPDSQEICFVPNQDYAGLVRRRSPETFREGAFVTADGSVIGAHAGHQQFTIGQRKGLGVALGYPVYVVNIDPAANRVTLGSKDDLLSSGLIAHQLNILSDSLAEAAGPVRCTANVRYNHSPQPATATRTGPDELMVRFDEPQSAITPGQAVVLYGGEEVLGGGWIDGSVEG